jgi:hypothetical protein
LLAAAFCVFELASVVADARLQARILGPSRATVTSLAGLGTELVTVLVFGVYAVASTSARRRTIFALFAVPYLVVAVVLAWSGMWPDTSYRVRRHHERRQSHAVRNPHAFGLGWARTTNQRAHAGAYDSATASSAPARLPPAARTARNTAPWSPGDSANPSLSTSCPEDLSELEDLYLPRSHLGN